MSQVAVRASTACAQPVKRVARETRDRRKSAAESGSATMTVQQLRVNAQQGVVAPAQLCRCPPAAGSLHAERSRLSSEEMHAAPMWCMLLPAKETTQGGFGCCSGAAYLGHRCRPRRFGTRCRKTASEGGDDHSSTQPREAGLHAAVCARVSAGQTRNSTALWSPLRVVPHMCDIAQISHNPHCF